MTEVSASVEVPVEDALEQRAPLDSAGEPASEALLPAPARDEVPEADMVEQVATSADPGYLDAVVGSVEVNEADAMEQALEVGGDEDYDR